jgi:hypothetical protein
VPHLAIYGTFAVLVGLGLLIRFGLTTRAGFAVLTVGTVLVLGMQVLWFPGNYNVINYRFPNSVSLLQQRFAKYQGTVVQVASMGSGSAADLVPNRAYQDMLYGSMYSVAGVDSTTDYSGIGLTKFDNALCMVYQGNTCAQAWTALWQQPDGYPVPLADLLRARTVVVQNALVDTRNGPAPQGWHRATQDEASGLATVWSRDAAPQWPGGRLSYASDGIDVTDDHMTGTVDEQLTYRSTGDAAQLVFARLAWPGYAATVNGQRVPTEIGPAGLLEVHLPAGVGAATLVLSWSPPGSNVSTVAFGTGAVLALGLILVPLFTRRRRRADEPVATGPSGEGESNT